jgi:hypothetical protein
MHELSDWEDFGSELKQAVNIRVFDPPVSASYLCKFVNSAKNKIQ